MDYHFKLKLLDDGTAPEVWFNKKTGITVTITGISTHANGTPDRVSLARSNGRTSSIKYHYFVSDYEPVGVSDPRDLFVTKELLLCKCLALPHGSDGITNRRLLCKVCKARMQHEDEILDHEPGCKLVTALKEIEEVTGREWRMFR